jgi:acyl dehydratase
MATDQVTINGIDDLKSRVGQEIGVSEWREVSQAEIDTFAEVTGDDQWIHVDPDRAKDTPFGGTIAHGYFTLSLGPRFSYDMYTMTGVAFALNYGLGKVRFPAPVQDVQDIPGGAQITMLHTFEVEGGEKPVCVAEALSRVYTG